MFKKKLAVIILLSVLTASFVNAENIQVNFLYQKEKIYIEAQNLFESEKIWIEIWDYNKDKKTDFILIKVDDAKKNITLKQTNKNDPKVAYIFNLINLLFNLPEDPVLNYRVIEILDRINKLEIKNN